jgi:hypothetical protein
VRLLWVISSQKPCLGCPSPGLSRRTILHTRDRQALFHHTTGLPQGQVYGRGRKFTQGMRQAPDVPGLFAGSLPLAQVADAHYNGQCLSISSKNHPVMSGRAVSLGRSESCPGSSAPAVRARASHGRGAGASSSGSYARSAAIPFVAICAAIGSGALASAGARAVGASLPCPVIARISAVPLES